MSNTTTKIITLGASSPDARIALRAQATTVDKYGREVSTTVAEYRQKRTYKVEDSKMHKTNTIALQQLRNKETIEDKFINILHTKLRGGSSANVIMTATGDSIVNKLSKQLAVTERSIRRLLKEAKELGIIALIDNGKTMVVNPYVMMPLTLSKSKQAQLQNWWDAMSAGETDSKCVYEDIVKTANEEAMWLLEQMAIVNRDIVEKDDDNYTAQQEANEIIKDPDAQMALLEHMMTLLNNNSNKGLIKAAEEGDYNHMLNYINKTELPYCMKVLPNEKGMMQDLCKVYASVKG